MKTKLLSIYLGILFVCSCGVKTNYEEIQETIKQLEKINSDLPQGEWDSLDLEIKALKEDLKNNRENYTEEEIEKLNKMIGNYYALKLSHKAKNAKKNLQDASQQIEGMYETFSKLYNDSTKK